MRKSFKLISALLCLALTLSCFAIFAAATEPADAPVAQEAASDYDAEALIESAFNATAPILIFGKGEGDADYQYLGYSNYWTRPGKETEDECGLWRWFSVNGNDGQPNYTKTADKDILVILRSDYEYHSARDEEIVASRHYAENYVTCRSLTIDLNGHTLSSNTSKNSYIYKHSMLNSNPYSQATNPDEYAAWEASYDSWQKYGTNITFKNGTIKLVYGTRADAYQYSLFRMTADGGDSAPGKGLTLSFDGIDFLTDKTEKHLMSRNLGAATYTLPEGTDAYAVNMNFKNCQRVNLEDGVAKGGGDVYNTTGGNLNASPMTFNATCEHGALTEEGLCNFCGECTHKNFTDGVCDQCGFVAPLPFTVEAVYGEPTKIIFKSKLAAPVKAIEVVDAMGEVKTLAVGTDIVAGEDGYYVVEIEIPADALTKAVSVKLLNEANEVVALEGKDGAIDAYTANIFDIINAKIDAEKEALKNELAEVNAALAAKAEELQAAIDGKASAEEVAQKINELNTIITEAYAEADKALGDEIDELAGELSELEVTLANAKTTLETAIKKVEDDLAAAVASLNAAIALKADATKLAEEIAKVSAAYAAADLVLTENDEALAAADASLKAAIDKLRADVDDHTARLDSIDTMNIVIFVLIGVAAVIAVVALILPIVKGKKKE